MAQEIPQRTLAYQVKTLSNDPKLRSTISHQFASYKSKLRKYKEDVLAYEREQKRVEEENKRIDEENRRREEEYQRQLKQLQEEEYRYSRIKRKRASARTTTTETYSYIQAPEGYQGITTKQGETLQNIKTGEILPIYNLTPQETAKRELLIKAKLIKPEESPTSFIVPDKTFKPEKPIFLKDTFAPTYLKTNVGENILSEERKEIIRKSDRPLTALLTGKYRETYKKPYYVFDIPFYALRETKSRLPKSFVSEKYPSLSYKKTQSIFRDVTTFSFFSPYMKTSTETLFESSKYIKPKDLKIKESITVIKPSKVKGIKKVESIGIIKLQDKPLAIGASRQYVGRKNIGIGESKTILKSLEDKKVLEKVTGSIVSKGKRLSSSKSNINFYVQSYLKDRTLTVSRQGLKRSVKLRTPRRFDETFISVALKPKGTYKNYDVYRYGASSGVIKFREELINYAPNLKAIASKDRQLIFPAKKNIQGILLVYNPFKSSKSYTNVLKGSVKSRLSGTSLKVVPIKTSEVKAIATNIRNIQNAYINKFKESSKTALRLGSGLKVTSLASSNLERTRQSQGTLTKQKTLLTPKYKTRLETITRTRLNLNYAFESITKTRTKQQQIGKLKLIEKTKLTPLTKLRPSLNLNLKSTLPKPSRFFTKPFYLSLDSGLKRKSKPRSRYSKSYKYTPSFTASVLKIKTKYKPYSKKGYYLPIIRPLTK